MIVSGLQVTDSKIALLTLKQTKKNLRIISFSSQTLKEGIVQHGLIKKEEDFANALKELRNQAKPKKVSSPYVIVAIPDNLVYLTTRILPNVEEEKIREAIEINLSEFVPGEDADIYWGWQEVAQTEKGREILIAASAKKDLTPYLECLSKANLIPIALETSSLATSRAFSKPQTALVVDAEKNYILITALDEGVVRFSRGEALSSGDPKSLSTLVKKVLNYYRSEKNLPQLPILLTGDFNSEAENLLKEELKVDVTSGKNLLVLPESNMNAPIALGSALRGLISQKDDKNLSLLPVGSKEAYELKRVLNFLGGITNLVIITSVLFLGLYAGFWGLFSYLNQEASKQLDALSKVKISPEVAEMQKNMVALGPKIEYIKGLLVQESPISPYLGAINSAQEGKVALTNIVNQKDAKTINLTGTATSRDTLASFKDDLTKSGFFEKVDLSSTTSSDANIGFTMTLTMKKRK